MILPGKEWVIGFNTRMLGHLVQQQTLSPEHRAVKASCLRFQLSVDEVVRQVEMTTEMTAVDPDNHIRLCNKCTYVTANSKVHPKVITSMAMKLLNGSHKVKAAHHKMTLMKCVS